MSLKKIIFSVASVLLIPWYVMGMESVDQSNTNNQVFNGTMHTTSYIIQGGKSIQEDVVYISAEKDQPILAAVFDGNGGIGQDAIEKNLLQKLIAYSNQSVINGDLTKGVIKDGFQEINNELNTIERTNEYGYKVSPWHDAGSTALILFLTPQYNKFIIAWCGDSEAIWSENGVLKITRPAHHLQERAGQYSFYRSFGNFAANNTEQSSFVAQSGCQMSADPESTIIDINNIEWILLATDGLWTYTNQAQAFDFIQRCLRRRKWIAASPNQNDRSDCKHYSDEAIIKKLILLSILNDVKHNLVEKWLQFFFKEYIRIIFPSLRQTNVKKNSYIENFKSKIKELICFMETFQFVLNYLPFRFFNEKLEARNYMKVAFGIDEEAFDASLEAGFPANPRFSLVENLEEYAFPEQYTVNPKTTKEKLNSMNAIICYLYCNLDDGTLADRLKEVFNLNFETEVSAQGDNEFCYQQRCFLENLQQAFLIIQKSIDSAKDNVFGWKHDYLDEKIKNIECFASDNTAIVFLNKEENEQKVRIEKPFIQNPKQNNPQSLVSIMISGDEQNSTQVEKSSIINQPVVKVEEDKASIIPKGNPKDNNNNPQVVEGSPQSLDGYLPENQQILNDDESSKNQNSDNNEEDKEPQSSRFSIFCSYIASFFSSCWQFFAHFLPW